MFLALRVGLSRRALTIGLVAVIVLLNVDRVDLLLGSASFRRVYFAPDGHFDVILVGCLAGLWYTGGSAARTIGRSAPVLAVAGLAAVGLMLALPEVAGWHVVLGLLSVLSIGIAALILAIVVDGRSPVASLLSLPPLFFVGKISYALYPLAPDHALGARQDADGRRGRALLRRGDALVLLRRAALPAPQAPRPGRDRRRDETRDDARDGAGDGRLA